MKRIYGLLALGLLVGCSPEAPKQKGKGADQVATQTQVETKAVAQETAPAVAPSK